LIIDVPADATVITPTHRPPVQDEVGAVTAALERPVAGPPLRNLVRLGATVAIAVCDVTRPQPRRPMLEALARTLDGVVRPEDVVVIIATGTHAVSTMEQRREMLGDEILRRWRVVDHDARDPASLVDLGMVQGVPVWLDREWVEADIRITTGFVEPHFFAGFSGGPKMVAPGLAGLETVLELHSPARIADPRATFAITEGNPVHDAVRAIADRTGVTYAVDVLIDDRHQITHAFGGPVLEMHTVACRTAREVAMQAVRGPFEIVITTNSGYPLDRNLYQSVKGMAAAATVVSEGGTIICASECRDGLPAEGAYARLLLGAGSIEEAASGIVRAGHAVPDGWQVQVQARVQARASVLLQSSMADATVTAAHLTAVDDVGYAVRDLLDRQPDAKVCALPEGPQTIPYLVGR
jgi:nickel-dependent lactate racemase